MSISHIMQDSVVNARFSSGTDRKFVQVHIIKYTSQKLKCFITNLPA